MDSSPEADNTCSALEDENMEQPDQTTRRRSVNLSIDTDIVLTEPEDWGKNTVNHEQKERYENSPSLTPSPHTSSARNLHESVRSPPSILRRPSKRLVKPPTYGAPTKASEAKKNEKLEFPAFVKRRDSGKDRLSRPNTSEGQSPSARSRPTSAPFSRPPSASPPTPVTPQNSEAAYTDEETGVDTDEEQSVKKEHADPRLQDLAAEIKRLQNENVGLMELQKGKDKALSKVSQLEHDNTELIQKHDQLLMNVQELERQKGEFWRRDLPPNASAKDVAIEDLEWNNATLRQKLTEKDEEVARLQREKANLEEDLESQRRELHETFEFAKQGQDELGELREENDSIIQSQQNLISTISKLMEHATKSISEDSDMESDEKHDLLKQLAADIETRSLHEKIHALFQTFAKSRRLSNYGNEELRRQINDMERQVIKLEAAVKTPPPAAEWISSPDIASPLSPQYSMSPLQGDREGFEALYRNEFDKHKKTKAQLKQTHFEKAKLSAEIAAHTEKISNLEQLHSASQDECTDLTNRVNELQSEAQSWQSELAESKSQLELRTSAFEQQAHRIRQECIRQIKSYYRKTADESNWRVTSLQARLSALQEDHRVVRIHLNASKREKASLEEEIVRRKTFALDPRFVDHANSIKEKHAGRGPLPSLALPVKPNEHGNLVMPETPTTPAAPLAKKETKKRAVPRYQLPAVKAAYASEAKEYRERLRVSAWVKEDVLAFWTKKREVGASEVERETSMKQTGKGGTSVEPVVSIQSPSERGLLSAMVSPRERGPLSAMISPRENAPLSAMASPSERGPLSATVSPRERTTTPYSSTRFLSPTLDFTPMPTSRFAPTMTSTSSTTLASNSSTSSTNRPISTPSLSLGPNVPPTFSSTRLLLTPNAFATTEGYTAYISSIIVNKVRQRKMGKALYPPGRKAYEEVKRMTVWDMWEGPKWAEEQATVKEIEVLKKRGIL